MGDDDVDDGLARDPRIHHVAPLHSKRQYRGQAVFVLLCLFGIAYITLKDHDFVAKDVGREPARMPTLDETLGAISPFAKKKCEDIYAHADTCAFVLKHCEESEIGMIHYLKFYFCTLGHVKPIGFILLVAWLGFLFSAIGIASSDFFCPNLATLSQTLRMSESMAGVTFLALGNGSPDLFSTFAAMRVGSGSLAIGELIGAAFFISSVVAGSMAIVNPFKVSRKSFLRDAIFFAGAVAFSVGLLADGKITTWETSAMIAYYVLYVAFVVVATWYWRKRSSRRRQESRARYTFARPEEGSVEEEDDEEGPAARESTALIGDVTDLENAFEDEDEEVEAEYANIQHRMSIVRPALEIRTPSHIHSNIRPSLFGALEFRSLSTKLGSASAMPGRYRRYSISRSASGETPGGVRNVSDPFAHFRTAPPRQAPWHSPVLGRSQESDDYFATHHHPSRLLRPVSPMTALPISEEPGDESTLHSREQSPHGGVYSSHQPHSPVDPKSSTFLKPPEVLYGSMRRDSQRMPLLRVDTSDMALTTSPLPLIIPTVSRDISRESSTPGSPLGFRDSREPDELTRSSRKPRFAWWPSFLLPDPQVLYLTLFPTVRNFREKSWLQRILAVLAVPAVFCFTVTLPVVDTEADEEEETFKFPRSPSLSIHPEDSPVMTAYVDAETEVVIIARAWNRWLTGVQCLVAPVFLTYLFFSDHGVLPILYALLVGLVTLALLLMFSSPTKPPKWHKALCAVGFIVSIGWISTIADEVVGILRAFGAILGVSEAILGVTIFAVGNSLSDFVADVTVAKMGYPMMAMSACFGGPMLNILLGVGVAGLFMNLTTAPVYNVSLSPTLLVSTVSLFLTLSSMLIVVPLMKWRMTRTFGICLVTFFTLSTVASVIVEILL